MKKEAIAKEWLLFLSFLFFGLLIFPALLCFIFNGNLNDLGDFYNSLLEIKVDAYDKWGRKSGYEYNPVFFQKWFIILFPYILFNFIRSIIWSIKTLLKKSNGG